MELIVAFHDTSPCASTQAVAKKTLILQPELCNFVLSQALSAFHGSLELLKAS